MIQLAFLLLGARFVERYLRLVGLLGVLWVAAGGFIIVDALDGVLWFPIRLFGILLLAEGVATFILTRSGVTLQTRFRYAKAVVSILIAILVIIRHPYSDFTLAMLFGLAFTLEGCLQIVAAWMVRYQHWRFTVAMGVVSLLIAVIFFEPWPTHYRGTIPYCIGVWLVVTGCRMVWLYLRLRNTPRGDLLQAIDVGAMDEPAAPAPPAAPASESEDAPMVVHVWTPVGSSKSKALRRPVIDRYIAAVDVNGVISTGHASLEAGPGTYVSLYPGVEIDRSPDEFARLLRADATNDIPGRYLTSYLDEAASWCESTAKIAFRRYDIARLHAFWTHYRQTEIYNLTSRNCSSTVALAMEAALEGCAPGKGSWLDVLRLLATPELWVAAQLRHRAHKMAWTPGLVLDYARALRVVVHPPAIGWLALFALAVRQSRRSRQRA